ncbi:MAG: MATE family efflux transporter [Ruminococcaceae bacterium]|nr:MATE family efflux transporter [Oscillospiraceae bacterium]
MIPDSTFYGTEKINRIILKIAPPVMLAQLIQALYNIVDSFFVGRFSESGLTALSIIYPLQLLMIALGVGTGVGINTAIAYYMGLGKDKRAKDIAGIAAPLAVVLWVLFAAVCWFVMPAYARMSTDSQQVTKDVVTYGRIVCIFSFGLFAESVWSKILQARGDMKTPMTAQIIGAVINIILDPILIFGMSGIKPFGIAGAAIATVVGQIAAALVVMKKAYSKSPALRKYPFIIKKVYSLGIPNILMQSAYTFYILGLNLILSTFCDQAVTVLGLYYKWQTFFFIPMGAMQTCMVPVISYNFAAQRLDRCKTTFKTGLLWGFSLMFAGTLCFVFMPQILLSVFSSDPLVLEIGNTAFKIIGIGYIPLTTSLLFPVFFQALGQAIKSSALTIVRTVLLFVPLGYLFSRIGLGWFWLTFPVTEILTSLLGLYFYRQFFKNYS